MKALIMSVIMPHSTRKLCATTVCQVQQVNYAVWDMISPFTFFLYLK